MRIARWMLVLTVAVTVCGITADAAAYPDKPITLVVPFPAGGGADLIARNLAEIGKTHFPQPIAVVNRPGGGGSVAASEVVRARPDGYTLGLMTMSIMTLQPHRVALPYKTPDDYASVIEIINVPVVLVVRADAPWKTAREMIEAAKKEPGKIRIGSPGIGTTVHIAIEILKDQSGSDVTHVPFAGNAESIPALLGGHVEAIMLHPSDVLPHLRAGKARFLATSEKKRSSVYPDVPTFAELGFPDAGIGVYYSVFAPKGTPPGVIRTLHDGFKKVIESDAFRKFARETSANIEYRGPAELKRELEKDYVFFGKVAEKLKLKR
ncbi:MAG: tripartite tricarboxylate transporter substrate binding protein [Candidatus Rokubacteria bacterium]|nr:tripartite tricarboxylate transporter substrate binding protein [Candidatus Rokubacteria bacterium]